MAQQSMRGIRLGSQSMESEIGVELFPRLSKVFRCPLGHVNEVTFAKDAELPAIWQCRKCPNLATLTKNGKTIQLEADEFKNPRSHFDMLMERRTKAELEELLRERISYIRARRKAGKADI